LRPVGMLGRRAAFGATAATCAPTRGHDFGFRSDSLQLGGSGIFLGGASASRAGRADGPPDSMVALR
jgi:hypothetical protein